MELGRDPSHYIVYPGGNAYYVDPELEAALDGKGIEVDADELDALFEPFVRPDIRRATAHFRDRASRAGRAKLTEREIETIRMSVHAFDKRRRHFLKFGSMDQGPVERMPPVLFRDLMGRSRDEIEQRFMDAERELRESELKTYVYTAFDIQRYFTGPIAVRMPQALDQDKIDQFFIEALCQTNHDLFNPGGEGAPACLHDYLVRYVIMFFDYAYADSTLLNDYVNDFIYRHHFYKPQPQAPKVSLKAASGIFGIDKEALRTMTRKGLRRRYRKLAREHHPDTGGSHAKFVELSDAYRRLCEMLKR